MERDESRPVVDAGAGHGLAIRPAPRNWAVRSIADSTRLDAIAGRLQDALARVWRRRGGARAKDLLQGTWLGHPLHPALTDIPIGAWTTAAVLDAMAVLTGNRRLDRAASTALAVGAAGAVGAAASGLADFSDTGGSRRRIGAAHAGLNTAALALTLASLWRRRRRRPGARLLSLAGLGLAAAAGYLGGDLVYRLGTQVNRNAWARGGGAFTDVLADSALADEQPTRVEAEGTPVMLVRHHGAVYALGDVCSHAGCSLSRGHLETGAIRCPCHGSTFRRDDGAVLHGPSPFPQPSYDVKLEAGRICVRRR